MKIFVSALILFVAASEEGMAAANDQKFFIVRDVNAQSCHVQQGQPADKKMIVGNRIYKSRDDAVTDLPTICNGP